MSKEHKPLSEFMAKALNKRFESFLNYLEDNNTVIKNKAYYKNGEELNIENVMSDWKIARNKNKNR